MDASGAGRLIVLGLAGLWLATGGGVARAAKPAVGDSLVNVVCPTSSSCTAVGASYSPHPQHVVLFSKAAGTWRAPVTARLPANVMLSVGAAFVDFYDPLPPMNFAHALSCAAPGDCTAVGGYDNTRNEFDGVLLTETNGHWGAGVEEPLPPNALPHRRHQNGPSPRTNEATSVSCAAPGDCTAFGFYEAKGFPSTGGLLLTETNGRWVGSTQALLPADAASLAHAGGVSCGSVGNCAAVGDYEAFTGTGNSAGVLLDETNGTWAPGIEVIHPGKHPYYHTRLTSVSCASPGNCTAVGMGGAVTGTTVGSLHLAGLLLTETNGKWAGPVLAPLPANRKSLQETPYAELALDSVSCPSAGDCTAVGDYLSRGGHEQGLMLTETNGVWATGVQARLPAGAWSTGIGPEATLNSVSCASPGNCTAVGQYYIHRCTACQQVPLLLTEHNGRWSTAARGVLPAGAASRSVSMNDNESGLRSVSCPSPGNCTAVGSYPYLNGLTPSAWGVRFTQTNGRWARGVWVKAP